MKIYGFVGPSGTGKSHRATWVAREKDIEYIIDDGLLIKGNRIIAGSSAKKERTKIASVKRAMFMDPVHTREVAEAIKMYKPQSILILGTSDEMVNGITKRLGYKGIDEKISIYDVASEYEIEQAISTRKEQGKHVIPVPTFELKRYFSGYFLDPLKIFQRQGKGAYHLIGEKSVVRPTYSYLGNYTISEHAIYQIIEFVVSKIEGVNKISKFRAQNSDDGIYIEIDLVLYYGYVIKPLLEEIRHKIAVDVERLTAINIKAIDLFAKSLVLREIK